MASAASNQQDCLRGSFRHTDVVGVPFAAKVEGILEHQIDRAVGPRGHLQSRIPHRQGSIILGGEFLSGGIIDRQQRVQQRSHALSRDGDPERLSRFSGHGKNIDITLSMDQPSKGVARFQFHGGRESVIRLLFLLEQRRRNHLQHHGCRRASVS